MSPGLFAAGYEFEGIGTGYILVAAVLVCIALVAFTCWYVLRDDTPSDARDDRTDDAGAEGW